MFINLEGVNAEMNQYTYFILGIILGLSIAIVYFFNKEEKEERILLFNQEMFSSNKLDKMLDEITINIKLKVIELDRKLTEEEKNDIISKCYKRKFNM